MIASTNLLSLFFFAFAQRVSTSLKSYMEAKDMLSNGLHQKHCKKTKLILVTCICVILLLGCNRSNVESPNNNNNIWGFGNIVKNESNTFQSNTASVADTSSYTYVDQVSFSKLIKDSIIGQYEGIYQSNYQQEALAQMNKLKEAKIYSTENPLFIQNPFGTNSSSLYVYFGAPTQQIILYYIVSASDETIPDFSDTMYFNSANTLDLEGQMIGLIAGQQNKIVLDVRDDAGSKISKKAYFIDVPAKASGVAQRLSIETSDNVEYTRGLLNYLVKEKDSSYFVFYDNNGILRGEIPTYVRQPDARILPAGNQIFYEYSDNLFALLNNLGFVVQTYSYDGGDNIIDYDYDSSQRKVLLITEDAETLSRDKVVSLNLDSGEWYLLVDFKNLLRSYFKSLASGEEETQEKSDWLGLNYIYAVEGKDLIVFSKELNSIIRVNNIYSQPVIRWIIAKENQWKDTSLESLVLSISGKNIIGTIGSVAYSTSKKLKEGQIYLSLISSQSQETSIIFGKYIVDENQNRFRLQQSLTLPSNYNNCSAIGYGTHAIIALWSESSITEYNNKGEIMLRMILPSTNFSYRIYKYTMDRYWF